MSYHLRYLTVLIVLAMPLPAFTQFAVEDADETGVTNPSDFSWRYYKDAMDRFPSRVGIICHSAHILDKTGSYTDDTLMFMTACAEKGNVAAMVYLSALYESGNRMPIDLVKSAYWLKRGSEVRDDGGYSDLAAYHYGVALSQGRGVEKNVVLAREYLQRAADAGVQDALVKLNDLNAD